MQTFNAYRWVAMSLAVVSLSGCAYNNLAEQDQAIKAEWTQVQNELQQRNDLTHKLIELMKAYAPSEQSVMQAAADSGARLTSARTPSETIDAANQQSIALAALLAIVENSPQLKANDSFNQLMGELAGAENRIAVERMRYNAFVQQYQLSRRRFPAALTARLFNFQDYPFFEVPAPGRETPKVQPEQRQQR